MTLDEALETVEKGVSRMEYEYAFGTRRVIAYKVSENLIRIDINKIKRGD